MRRPVGACGASARWGVIALCLLLPAFFGPLATAQEPPEPPDPEQVTSQYFEFDFVVERTFVEVDALGRETIGFTVKDLSRDAPAGFNEAAPPGGASFHSVTIEIEPDEELPGWRSIAMPASFQILPGQEKQGSLLFFVDAQVTEPYFPVTVHATLQSATGETVNKSVRVTGYTEGLRTFSLQSANTYSIGPREITDASLRLTNAGIFHRTFVVEVESNPCGLDVAPPAPTTIAPKGIEDVSLTIQGPAEKFWYNYELCTLMVAAYPQDSQTMMRRVPIPVQVNGFYVDPAWVFTATGVIAAVAVLAFLLARQKQKVDEQILGKPQKPWEIPVEQVYLKHLKRKDEQAHYLVRHFLMEDEYRSAMAWFHSYKKATRGERKKERVIVGHEKRLENWEQKWAKRIEKPDRKAARFEAKLEKKLAKQVRKDHRKAMRKWGKKVRKLEARHSERAEKAQEAWEKQAKKAQKKGLDVPPAPDLGEPELPPEPERPEAVLSAHRWSKRNDRYQQRMLQRKARLEARYERSHDRQLRKVRRKVKRVARKLDDPDFVAEHPLLRDAAPAERP